jgi:hypothetical protein
MSRIRSAIWVMRAVFAVLVAVVYARKNYNFKKKLVELQRSTRAIDAHLAEIKRLSLESSRSEEAAAKRARREFEGIDLSEFAERFHLVAISPRRK